MLKRLLAIGLISAMSLSIFGCQNTETEGKEEAKTVTISVQNANKEMVDIEVPVNPEKVVVLDYVALDMIDSWGLGDKVVGMPKDSTIPHLSKYSEDKDIVNLGGLKEIDMEALMSLEPDIIFTSGRTAAKYDEFSKIAPTVMTSISYGEGYMESFETMAKRNASIFGMEEKVEKQLAKFDDRIAAIKEKAEGKSAVVGIITGGALNTLGNDSRGSIIGTTLGFENLAADLDSAHGNVASFELLLDLNPDYAFIIDRDTAISAEGASTAEKIMDNEIVYQTDAYKNDRIAYLNPVVWYMVEGGITAMDIMLSDIEAALN